VAGQPRDQCRHLFGIAGSDDHEVDAGEDRPVNRERDRQLDLPQVVDTDLAIMTLLGQEDLHEVAHHRQLLQGPIRVHGEGPHILERPVLVFAAGNEVRLQHAAGCLGMRKRGQSSSDVTTLITQLQAPGHYYFQNGPRHHPQRPAGCHRPGQRPA